MVVPSKANADVIQTTVTQLHKYGIQLESMIAQDNNDTILIKQKFIFNSRNT